MDRYGGQPFGTRADRLSGGWVRISVTGDVDVQTAAELERRLLAQLASGRDVLLDLSAVSFIDSSGVHAIVAAVRSARSRGRELVLHTVLPRQARKLFDITRLDDVVPFTG